MTVDWCPTSEYHLASGSADGTVTLWDTRQGGLRAMLSCMDLAQEQSFGLSRVGDMSVTNPRMREYRESRGGKGGRVSGVDWNRHSGRLAHTKEVMCVKFSSCGRHVLSCGNDRAMRLWVTHTGRLLPITYAGGCAYGMRYQVAVSDILGGSNDLLLYPDDRTGMRSV